MGEWAAAGTVRGAALAHPGGEWLKGARGEWAAASTVRGAALARL